MAIELFNTPFYNDANLINYWRLNEGSGGTSFSDSKGSNTGTASRTQILGNAGLFVNCGTFAAASSDKVTLTDINGHTAFTINIWAKIGSQGGYRVPFASSDGLFEINCTSPNINVGAQVWVDRNGTTGTNKNASVYVSASYDTNWHMYTLTANGTSYALYMDANLLSSSFSLGTSSNSYVGTRIGCFHQSSGTPADVEFWDGSIDDCSYFSRDLSSSEITQLYTGSSASPSPSPSASLSPSTSISPSFSPSISPSVSPSPSPEYGIDKLSTSATYDAYWRSNVYTVGNTFSITLIRIGLGAELVSGMTIVPKLYIDDGSVVKTMTTINPTNYSGRYAIYKTPEINNFTGSNNFYLELNFQGTTYCPVLLPIRFELDIYPEEA